jgi:hypothetical protein
MVGWPGASHPGLPKIPYVTWGKPPTRRQSSKSTIRNVLTRIDAAGLHLVTSTWLLLRSERTTKRGG